MDLQVEVIPILNFLNNNTNHSLFGSDGAINGVPGNFAIYVYDFNDIEFSTNSTRYLIVKGAGRILMNTTIDDGVNQLQVNGFVKSSGYRINGGTSTQYLMADGTTSTSSGGGTVSASGLNTQIQFNDNGVFGANVSFTFDKTNNDLVLGGTDTGIILKQLQMNQQHQQLEIFKYMQKCKR
jgi:hypothetical protein